MLENTLSRQSSRELALWKTLLMLLMTPFHNPPTYFLCVQWNAIGFGCLRGAGHIGRERQRSKNTDDCHHHYKRHCIATQYFLPASVCSLQKKRKRPAGRLPIEQLFHRYTPNGQLCTQQNFQPIDNATALFIVLIFSNSINQNLHQLIACILYY